MKKILPIYFGTLPALLLLCSAAFLLVRCKKDPPVQNPTAQGSLQDAKGYCLPNMAHGTFIKGVASYTDSDYVELNVDVSRIGTYAISSETVHGVMFSDSGSFTRTGINSVRLKPKGAFTFAGATTFPIVYGNTYCEFTVTPIDTSLPEGMFHFTADGHLYSGNAGYTLNFPPEGHPEQGYLIEIDGATKTQDSLLHILVPMPYMFPSSTYGITYGDYSTSTAGTSFTFVKGSDSLFYADPATAGKVVNFHFDTVYTAHTGIQIVAHGKFAGTATNKAGASISITNGEFKAVTD